MADPRRFDAQVSVSAQIMPEDVAGLAASGIRMIINNRPDGEDDGQPNSHAIESAAASAGIDYRHVPVVRGMGPSDIDDMRQALREAGDRPVLAYCRSGNRSALITAMARRRDGRSRTEVEQSVTDAGFDASAISHLL